MGPKLQVPLLHQFELLAAPKGVWKPPKETRVRAWQDVLLRALCLAFPKSLPRLLEEGPRDRHDRVALASVGDLLAQVCDDVSAKALSGRLRQLSVGERQSFLPIFRGTLALSGLTDGLARKVLFQLSRFGRAGPYPTAQVVRSSEEQHRKDLTRVFTVPAYLRKGAFRFAARWAHGKRGIGKASYGTSAATDATRASGGWRVAVKRICERFRETVISLEDVPSLRALVQPFCEEFTVVDPLRWAEREPGVIVDRVKAADCLFLWEKRYAEDFGFTLDTWEVQREHLVCLAACLQEMRINGWLSGAQPLEARRVVVRERGGKARVVTPLPAAASFVGTYLNHWLLGLCAMDPRSDPYSNQTPVLRVMDYEYVRSADLTRATDLIPGPLAGAIARGICRGLGLVGSSVEQALLAFCRPVWVRPKDEEPYLTNGAPLMGAGPTWPLLNVYNLWLATSSYRSDRLRTVGDDLLAVGSVTASELYNARLTAVGGGVSVSKDTLSLYAGCLVERLCVVERGALVWYDTVSVGSLSSHSRVLTKGDEIPGWARGPSITSAPGVDYIVSKVFADDFRRLRAYGLDPYLPREFGGAGFPGSAAQVRHAVESLKPYWARALRVVMSQGQRSVALLLRLQAPWQSTFLVSHQDLDDWVCETISAWEVEARRRRDSVQPEDALTLEAFEREVVARLRSGFDLSRGFEQERSRTLSLRSVVRDLDRVLLAVNAVVPGHRLADLPRNLTDGLMAFLERIRGDYFVVPPEFRVSPGFGAARVGR